MSELDNVRQELLERGDEMVSFRQLIERFDEVEKYFKGTPWNLKQIYTNFNILIGEKPCGDCVDREEAMKCIKGEFYEDVEAVIYSSCRRIAHLPPVLPKQTDVPNTNIRESDCISREAAICLADELKDDLPDDDHLSDMVMSHNEGILEYQTKLSLLPSVAPQPKTGRWEKAFDEYSYWYRCSCCGNKILTNEWGTDYFSPYCPECGAIMNEEEE